MKFHLIPEQVDAIIVEELETQYKDLLEYNGIPMFSTDPKEDRKERKKTVKALKRVLDFYTVGGSYNG